MKRFFVHFGIFYTILDCLIVEDRAEIHTCLYIHTIGLLIVVPFAINLMKHCHSFTTIFSFLCIWRSYLSWYITHPRVYPTFTVLTSTRYRVHPINAILTDTNHQVCLINAILTDSHQRVCVNAILTETHQQVCLINVIIIVTHHRVCSINAILTDTQHRVCLIKAISNDTNRWVFDTLYLHWYTTTSPSNKPLPNWWSPSSLPNKHYTK